MNYIKLLGESFATTLIKRKLVKSIDSQYLQGHQNIAINQNRQNFITPPISPNLNMTIGNRARGYSGDGMIPLKAGWLLKKRDILNGKI